MEVPVADHSPSLVRRPMVGQPCHGRLQAAEGAATDPALETCEVALERDRLTADLRCPDPARCLAFAVERLEQDLGVECVKPELQLDQHRSDSKPLDIEQ